MSETAAVLGVCGPYVDVWKLGWGTAYLDPGLPEKLALLAEHGVLACTGGTLLEIAWHQGVADKHLEWAAAVGFPCVEVSCGVVRMTPAERADLVRRAAERFVVLGEIGLKDPARGGVPRGLGAGGRPTRSPPARAGWSPRAARAGRSGCSTPTARCGPMSWTPSSARSASSAIVFEAPRKDQQAGSYAASAADVNLGNIVPAEVLALEALRLGLRADTFDHAGPPVTQP